jgi:hypothetical protein
VEEVVAKELQVPKHTAWALPFADILDTIKYANDTAAANYLHQKAQMDKVHNT